MENTMAESHIPLSNNTWKFPNLTVPGVCPSSILTQPPS